MKRGRPFNPSLVREGECQVCSKWMQFSRDQSYRVSKGMYRPVCSRECLKVRQRGGGLSGPGKLKVGPSHPNWVDGRSSKATVELVVSYLVKHRDASTEMIRSGLGSCSDGAIARARRAVGIPRTHEGPKIYSGFYTNIAKEARKTIADINRYVANINRYRKEGGM